MSRSHPHAVSEWKTGLDGNGNAVVGFGHAPSPEDTLAGRGQWTELALTPQQAAALARDLMRTEGRSPQMMGEEI
jgi:hypothetical protein